MERLYLVKGRFDGVQVNEEVGAYSKRQAKLKAGFNAGFGGQDIAKFIKSSKIRVSLI